MVLKWPPESSNEMLALQEEYGRDLDIAVALGVKRHSVEQLRQAYKLPTVTKRRTSRLRKRGNLGEVKIAELYAGQRYR